MARAIKKLFKNVGIKNKNRLVVVNHTLKSDAIKIITEGHGHSKLPLKYRAKLVKPILVEPEFNVGVSVFSDYDVDEDAFIKLLEQNKKELANAPKYNFDGIKIGYGK